MRRLIRSIPALVAILCSGLMVSLAMADDDHHDSHRQVQARLSGFNEVHFSGEPPATLRGAVSTEARGTFTAKIDEQDNLITYELRYQDLEGEVTQGHIHFGQQHTVGGIVVWLCQTEGTPAPDEVADVTPVCPEEGSVTGTITPEQVLEATNQGLDAGEFDELVGAIRAGTAYVNVHSSLFPPGEIRGQIDDHEDDDHEDD
jgi:CHRD domain